MGRHLPPRHAPHGLLQRLYRRQLRERVHLGRDGRRVWEARMGGENGRWERETQKKKDRERDG